MNGFVFFLVTLPFFLVVTTGGTWLAGLVVEVVCLGIAAAVWQANLNAANRRAPQKRRYGSPKHNVSGVRRLLKHGNGVISNTSKSGMAAVDGMPGVEFESTSLRDCAKTGGE